MNEGLPIVIIVIAAILVALILISLILLRRNKGKLMHPVIKNRKKFFAQFIAGIILALMAAFFMFDGDILGENTTGIAMVIGIIGISLISTSNVTSLNFKRE